jgi:hypothetical protein
MKGIRNGLVGGAQTVQIQDSHCRTEGSIRVRGYKRNMIQQALGQAAALELVLVAYLTKIIIYMLLVLRTTCMCSLNKG